MARNIITTITDDIDGTPDAFGHTFSLNGVSYEIDLAEKNADKLVKALAPFIDKARKVNGSGKVSKVTKGSGGDMGTILIDGKQVIYSKSGLKAWAADTDTKLSRGRVPREIVESYLKTVK